MSFYTILLIVHLSGVAVWLGGALYERVFLVGNLRRLRGTGHESNVLRMMLSTEGYFLAASTAVLITGIVLSVMSGAGFFRLTWLGVKQGVMLGILILFVTYVGPQMKRLKESLSAQMEKDSFAVLPESCHKTVTKITYMFDIAHAGVLLNIVMAVWKP